MAIGFPLGIDDYKKLRNSGAIYVDKSLMIKEILEDATESYLITRPRRFGKTINMSMIKYFFDVHNAAENRKLFEDTLIANASYESNNATINCMDEQGKYPVVFITFKELRYSDYDVMYSSFEALISGLYLQHKYLMTDKNSILEKEEAAIFQTITNKTANIAELMLSLKKLTIYLQRYHKKPVFLLLDEYDTPLHAAYSATEPFHEKLIEFMMGLLGAAFKGNPALKQGIMTGILRVSLMNLFSGVNNVIVRSVLDTNYDNYFGFTENETSGLFKQLDRKQDEAKVKTWYNGYKFGNTTIYNPWSIINCLANNDGFKAYWVGTGEHGVLGKALISCSDLEVFDQLQKLLEGNSIDIVVDERTIFASLHGSQRALWNLMLYSGYLTPVKQWQGDADLASHVEAKLPNYEVNFSIKRMVEDWISLSDTKSINNELEACLKSGDVKKFKGIIQRYILQTISYYDFNYELEERFYHIFMLGILIGLNEQFIIDSNKEAGLGRYDIILIPKDKNLMGIVLELKSVEVNTAKQERELKADIALREDLMEAEALEALSQIETRGYGVRFAQHDIKQYAAIGMAFLGKEFAVRHKVIDS